MYLKSLTLKGFKSFADKSVITVEPGVTCVVGPNGSGKSNISDAILWVLGEQSAKSLRGQAMEDVIFAGSSARQAVGVAEVDLVLDNSDGALPLEFNEVTITRRMYRSGESEYLINQSPARLMDILDLLHDTGLGREAHSIISQGRIDEILKARPEERRALIEEAAGVLKHKKRKERAVRKLAGLDAHLSRATDIAHEIDRQLRPLERQASKTAQYDELSGQLQEIEVALAVDDLRILQGQWDDLVKVEKEADAEIDLYRYRLAESERELGKFQHLLEEKGLFVGDISEQRRRIQSILERLDAGLLLLEEKGKNLVARLSDLRRKLHNAQSRISGARLERDGLETLRAETEGKLKALYSQLSELRREGEIVRKARTTIDEELSQANNELRISTAKAEEAKTALLKIEQSLGSLNTQQELLRERLTGVGGEVNISQDFLATKRSKLESLDGDVSRIAREIALADSDVDKRVRVLESRRKSLDAARESLMSARTEIKGLEDIDRAFATASPALARVLSKSADIEGFVGPIADCITAAKEYEGLVEKLLAADLFGVLVADDSAAIEVAREVTSLEAGEISIVPLDVRPPKRSNPSMGIRLVDALSFEDRVASAVQVLLGDVVVVDSIQSALAGARSGDGFRYVTKEGVVAWPNGKVTLGTQYTDNEGVLARKRRLNELTDEMPAMVEAVGACEAEVSVAEEALALAQQDAFELNQKRAALVGEKDSLVAEIARSEEQLSKLTQEGDSLASRVREVEHEIAAQQPRINEINSALAQHESAITQAHSKVGELSTQRDSRVADETRVSQALSQCQVDIATVSERDIHLKRQHSQLVNEVRELEDVIENSEALELSLELLRERIEPLHNLYVSLQEKAEHWSMMLRDRARLEQADSESLRTTIHDAQDKVRLLQKELTDQSESVTELKIKKGQLEIQVNNAVARIVDEYRMPIEKALTLPFIEDRLKAEDKAFALRRKISNLGAVNPVAAQEYESLKARRDFMHEQVEDLQNARKALGKVIAAIDRKMKDRFLETFELVDKHFQNVFSILFPGGSAQLILTDPDNPETTGVEYTAQPRGKRVKKMSLLSGGENSLAALALLFAMNKVRPCPFYVLDEVEAALDDSNLRRFVTFVNSLRSSTQFVIVTHQRRTMEMADVLYGVSMQSDGVSKLVSQKLDRALESLGYDPESSVS